MKKPTMLYASPFNPIQSGISDYSETLVQALQEQFEVTLLIKDYEMTNSYLMDTCKILKYGRDQIPFEEFDSIIYNIGNQPYYHDYIYRCCLEHPGLVILHEFSLYYLFIGVHSQDGDVLREIYHLTGISGLHTVKSAIHNINWDLLECKRLAGELPLNQELLQSGNKFMVHSDYTYQKVMQTGCVKPEQIRKINLIALIDETTEYMERKALFEKYGVPQDALILTSSGFIGNTKLNHVVCKVVTKLSKELEQKICYVMVGAGNYTADGEKNSVDDYVDGKTIIKTGYTEIIEFNSFIKYSDIIINLRHPSMGETSSALIRILGLGKICIISDEAWFSEIPGNCAIKIGIDNIEKKLEYQIRELVQHPEKKIEYEKNAKAYIDTEHAGKVIVEKITQFLNDKGQIEC